MFNSIVGTNAQNCLTMEQVVAAQRGRPPLCEVFNKKLVNQLSGLLLLWTPILQSVGLNDL